MRKGGKEGELLNEQGHGGGRGRRGGGTTAEADGEAVGEVAFEEAEGGGESVQGGVGGVVGVGGIGKGRGGRMRAKESPCRALVASWR